MPTWEQQAAVVNRLPPGLLDLLGIKNGGKNPGSLVDQLMPVLEMRDWYMTQTAAAVSAAGSAAINAAGTYTTTGTTLTVPAGEWWYITDFSCIVDASATSAFSAQGFWLYPTPIGSQMAAFATSRVVLPNSDSAILNMGRGFWAPPTTSPRLQVRAFTGAGTGGWTCNVVFNRFRY